MGKFGLVSNFVTIGWTIFCIIMYSFPTYMPVLASGESRTKHATRLEANVIPDMNYVSACYGVIILIIAIDWFVRGRKNYRGQTMAHEDEGAHSIVGL